MEWLQSHVGAETMEPDQGQTCTEVVRNGGRGLNHQFGPSSRRLPAGPSETCRHRAPLRKRNHGCM